MTATSTVRRAGDGQRALIRDHDIAGHEIDQREKQGAGRSASSVTDTARVSLGMRSISGGCFVQGFLRHRLALALWGRGDWPVAASAGVAFHTAVPPAPSSSALLVNSRELHTVAPVALSVTGAPGSVALKP